MTQNKSSLILVVDDDARNAKLLERILETEGYRTATAPNGESALALIGARRPDMLLVDVMMPGLDGYELCRRVKADPETRAIPTLLVTALNAVSDKVRGLEAGADDFLTKPVNRVELVARVRTHFRIKQLRDEVVESHESLARQNRKLQALERMREDLTQMLVHDLKSPLSAIQLNVELLQQGDPALTDPNSRSALGNVAECAAKLGMLIGNILDVARLEEAEVSLSLMPFKLNELVDEVVQGFDVLLRMEGKRLRVSLPQTLAPAVADRNLVARVLQNLIANAVKASPEAGEVTIEAEFSGDGCLWLSVGDGGPGVPQELRERIFEKFSAVQAKGLSMNHGLGLTFCKLAVEAHGGRIWVESRPAGGSLFRFSLPRHEVDCGYSPAATRLEVLS